LTRALRENVAAVNDLSSSYAFLVSKQDADELLCFMPRLFLFSENRPTLHKLRSNLALWRNRNPDYSYEWLFSTSNVKQNNGRLSYCITVSYLFSCNRVLRFNHKVDITDWNTLTNWMEYCTGKKVLLHIISWYFTGGLRESKTVPTFWITISHNGRMCRFSGSHNSETTNFLIYMGPRNIYTQFRRYFLWLSCLSIRWLWHSCD
jgi:hypothetical protein